MSKERKNVFFVLDETFGPSLTHSVGKQSEKRKLNDCCRQKFVGKSSKCSAFRGFLAVLELDCAPLLLLDRFGRLLKSIGLVEPLQEVPNSMPLTQIRETSTRDYPLV